MKVFITGGNGFIGQATCRKFVENNIPVFRVTRSADSSFQMPDRMSCGGIGNHTDWAKALQGKTHVIHLAARVHRLENAIDENEYHRINVLGTEHLARAASQAGVQRFVFMSTAKVHGEGKEVPYSETDPPQPQEPYGKSKWEAEKVLRRISAETGMEVVILRPPLVYGPGVKANFLRLLQVAERGLPLPFSGISNQRSLIYLGNLVDALLVCLLHPKAAGETFLLRDSKEVSTPTLIDSLANELGRSSRQFSMPPALLRGLGGIVGRTKEVVRLTNSFRLDDRKILSVLGWSPPFTQEQGLRETVTWYLRERNGKASGHF